MYFLSREWAGFKWRPVPKVWKQPQDKPNKVIGNSYRWKSLAILIQNIALEFHYLSLQSRKLNAKFSIRCSFFLVSFFVYFFVSFFHLFFLSFSFCSVTHSSKSVRLKRTINTTNDCTTIRDLPFFSRTLCELWSTTPDPMQTRVAVALVCILCVNERTTRKLKVVKRRFAHRMNALLTEISLLFVRALCKSRSSSYETEHASQTLSGTSFCAYLHA